MKTAAGKKTGAVVSDFRKFITKGNILDLAIAVVVGSAFNKIVTSLANNIISPLAGIWFGGVDLTEYKWTYSEAVLDANGNVIKEAVEIYWGVFVQAVIEFLITALFVFITLRIILRIKKHMKKLEERARQEINEVIAKLDDKDDEEETKPEEAKETPEPSKEAEKQPEKQPETQKNAEVEQAHEGNSGKQDDATILLLSEIRDLLKQTQLSGASGKSEKPSEGEASPQEILK